MKNHTHNSQKGQALLLLVMMLATTMTIVMTVVFTSRNETKTAKLEQDSERSFSAAEAGIEAVMRVTPSPSMTFAQLGLSNLNGVDLNNSTVSISTPNDPFVSPLIQKDQQLTYYLADYNTTDGTFSNPFSGNLDLYYGSETGINCNQIALEMSAVYGTAAPYSVMRYVANYQNTILQTSLGVSTFDISGTPYTINTTSFKCRTSFTIAANARLMFIRVLAASRSTAKTRFGTDGTLATHRAQGRYIQSEAKTTSGVVKKVQLFQSYPQIPAELFVTSF
jgi:hypothetical protein